MLRDNYEPEGSFILDRFLDRSALLCPLLEAVLVPLGVSALPWSMFVRAILRDRDGFEVILVSATGAEGP